MVVVQGKTKVSEPSCQVAPGKEVKSLSPYLDLDQQGHFQVADWLFYSLFITLRQLKKSRLQKPTNCSLIKTKMDDAKRSYNVEIPPPRSANGWSNCI